MACIRLAAWTDNQIRNTRWLRPNTLQKEYVERAPTLGDHCGWYRVIIPRDSRERRPSSESRLATFDCTVLVLLLVLCLPRAGGACIVGCTWTVGCAGTIDCVCCAGYRLPCSSTQACSAADQMTYFCICGFQTHCGDCVGLAIPTREGCTHQRHRS